MTGKTEEGRDFWRKTGQKNFFHLLFSDRLLPCSGVYWIPQRTGAAHYLLTGTVPRGGSGRQTIRPFFRAIIGSEKRLFVFQDIYEENFSHFQPHFPTGQRIFRCGCGTVKGEEVSKLSCRMNLFFLQKRKKHVFAAPFSGLVQRQPFASLYWVQPVSPPGSSLQTL